MSNPKKLLLFCALVFACFKGLSQEYTLSGVVKDSSQAIAYANVILTDDNGEMVTGTITEKDGHFNLIAQKGKYKLSISFLGYQTLEQNIVLEKNTDLETVFLHPNNTQLQEVMVTGEKPLIEQKIDRLVFNIENTVMSSGGTANDALKITPNISYSGNKLSIIGKNGVLVAINNRVIRLSGEDLFSYLNSISSDNIKEIEIITTPPAKYEAEGDSGIINIVLRKNKSNSWNNSIRSTYTQRTFPSLRVDNTFLYSKNNFSVSASLSGEKGFKEQITTSDISYDEGPWIGKTAAKKRLDNFSGRINFNYDLNENISTGIFYNGSYRNNDLEDTNVTRAYNNNKEVLGKIYSRGLSDNDNESHDINLYYSHKFDTLGRELSVNFDYLNYKKDQERTFYTDRHFEINQSTNFLNSNNQNIDNYSLNFDFSHPTNWAKLSYGGNLLKTKTRNNLISENLTDIDSNTSLQNDRFNYTEDIQALYIDFTKEINSKWTVKGGVRYESTQAKGASIQKEDNFTRNYSNLFPSIYFNYKSSNKNNFNLSYSRRINRPNFYDLNPFRWYINSISYTEGNPFLQPKISDNLELRHIFKNRLISKVFVSIENEGFSQIPTVNPENNQQIFTRENFYNSFVIGLNETFIYNPFKWWKSVTQAVIYNIKGRFKKEFDLQNPISGLNAQFYTNHNFYIDTKKKYQIEATYVYHTSQSQLLYKLSPLSSLNIGFKTFFLHKKLQASLIIEDLFKTSAPDLRTYTNNIKQTYNTYNDNRFFRLSLNYRFGNDKLKSRKSVSGNKEIKERTN